MANRGRPSRETRQKIIDLTGKMSVEEIAQAVGLSVEVVKRFQEEQIGTGTSSPKASPAKIQVHKEFRDSAEWNELKRQLTKEELKYFEEKYTDWMAQLKEDATPSEKTQIFLLLKNEVLINRNMRDKNRATTDLSRMQTMLDDIYAKYPEGTELQDSDKQLVIDINEQLSATHAAMSARTTELIKLQERHAHLMQQLKATRDQRLKRVESAKESFIEYMKELMIEEKRLAEGEHMELMRIAAEKEGERLAGYHTYEDGVVDRPFLNADTVGLESPENAISPEFPSDTSTNLGDESGSLDDI